MIRTSQLIYCITPMAAKRKTKKYPHLEKRTAHGSWFVDISIVPELSHFYDGKSRLRHSLGTKDFAKALDTYSAEPPEALNNLLNAYELEHNLHSSTNQPVTNHPAYFAIRQLQTYGKHRDKFSATLAEVLTMLLAKRTDLSLSSVRSYKVVVNI